MSLANRMVIPGSGVTMNVITGDPTPAWTVESTEKTVSKPTFENKVMQPYKLAVIVPFSDQFRRDEAALYDAIVSRVPGALGKYFDQTVLFGDNNPGTNFDDLSAAAAVDVLQPPDPRPKPGAVECGTRAVQRGRRPQPLLTRPPRQRHRRQQRRHVPKDDQPPVAEQGARPGRRQVSIGEPILGQAIEHGGAVRPGQAGAGVGLE